MNTYCDVITTVREMILQNSLIPKVFTHVPPDAHYPYATLFMAKSEEIFNKKLITLKVNIFSNYRGVQEIMTLTTSVKDIFAPSSQQESHLRLKLIDEHHESDESGVRICKLTYRALFRIL